MLHLRKPLSLAVARAIQAFALGSFVGLAPHAHAENAPPERKAARVEGAGNSETQLPEVEVRDPRDAIEDRRRSPASRIVYERKDLERFNEMTVGDVLRKLPGVVVGGAPGEAKDISLRGLDKGYTQILIDGGRTLGGGAERAMEMDLLPADVIERIEIIRNPTAEQDANGIGGAINIVLRKIPAVPTASLRAGINLVQGEARPQFSGQYGGPSFGNFSYLLNGSAAESGQVQSKRRDTQEYAGGVRNKWEFENEDKRTRVRDFAFAPRLQWRLGEGDALLLEPLLLKQEQRTNTANDKSKFNAPATGANLVGNGRIAQDEDKERDLYRLQGEWRRRLALGEMRLRFSAQAASEHKDQVQREYNAADALTKTTFAPGSKDDREKSLAARWLAPFGSHLASLGTEAAWRSREDTKSTVENGVTKAASLQDRFDISEKKLVLWAQDEWQLNPVHFLTPGLRTEQVTTRSTDIAGRERSGTIRFLAPSLHYLWNATPATNLRASVARSVRPAKFDDLSNVVIQATGTNASANPDKSGNPDLRPESAVGIELGAEHFLPHRTGFVALNAFQRNVKDMVQKRVVLESNGRWVERPFNAGDGRIWGLEADFKLRMDALGLPELTLVGNHSLLRSRITDENGVTGKVKNQPRHVSNLGFAYDAKPWGLSFGANYTLRGQLLQEDSASKHQTEARTARLDLFVAKRLDRNFTLRFTAGNVNDGSKDKETLEFSSPDVLKKSTREITRATPVYYLSLEGRW